MNPKIVAVVPTIRPESMRQFREAWTPLFEKHDVTLVTVWDGDQPEITTESVVGSNRGNVEHPYLFMTRVNRDLFCRRTDAVRNIGFVKAAELGADFVFTADDDVQPVADDDPIQAHLDALDRRVPLSWMNTAHQGAEYLRGVPYGVRDEAPVMLSHGVWVGVPDFDGETQLRLERCPRCDGTGNEDAQKIQDDPLPCRLCGATGKNPSGVPRTLPYYVGPIPRGVNAAICGMNLMVRKEALPYLYFAPMGPDSGVEGLHRFGDIWMGLFLKREFDRLGWAVYTGASTILHTRASDAAKNREQEKLGRQWNEWLWKLDRAGTPDEFPKNDPTKCGAAIQYINSYAKKRERFADLIRSIQEDKSWKS